MPGSDRVSLRNCVIHLHNDVGRIVPWLAVVAFPVDRRHEGVQDVFRECTSFVGLCREIEMQCRQFP